MKIVRKKSFFFFFLPENARNSETINNLVITIIIANQREKREAKCFTKGLYGYLFEGLKNAFNIQKVRLKKKKIRLVQKIESTFKGLKSLKIVKTHF